MATEQAPPPCVRVAVRPLHAQQYVDARIGSSAVFDVVLQQLTPPSRFCHIQRSLHDFVQLQRELELDNMNANALGNVDIASAITEYLAVRRERTLAGVASVHLFASDELVDARFAWQLEHALASLLTHAAAAVRSSRALQKFITGGSALAHPAAECEYHTVLSDLLTAAAGDGDDGGRSDSDVRAACTSDRIPSGCTVEHTVAIRACTPHAPQLVVWQFASEGDCVEFSARFAAHTTSASACDFPVVTHSADPYSAVACTDEYAATRHDACDAVDALTASAVQLQHMAHYRTRYKFASPSDVATSGSQRVVVGHYVAYAPGELVLEWANTDRSSVVSKPLTYTVRVVPLATAIATRTALRELLGIGLDAPDAASERGRWLEHVLAASTLQSVDDIFRPDGDDDDGNDNDDDDDANSYANADERGGRTADSPKATATGAMQRLQEEKSFHEQRAQDLEFHVSALEHDLRTTKNELQRAHDELAISSEVYKASLEAIAQLEIHAVTQQQQQQSLSPSATPSAVKPPAEAVSEPSGEEEYQDDDTDTCVESSPRMPHGVSDEQHARVVALCSTFQEQCLWRAIELSESEKRNLALTAELAAAEQRDAALQQQIDAHARALAALEAQNRTLRAHKSVLVHEVKRLQPFSQLNVAALVQEAHEARMVQRSLQTQLDAHRAAAASSADVTASIVVVDAVGTPSSSPTTATMTRATAGGDGVVTAADDDGAGGGFVVIESEDHSSFGEAATSEL